MPYIADDERRTLLANGIAIPANKAELAFKVAVDVDDYFIDKAVSFTTLSDALSALESVSAEVQRRFLNRYEDQKTSENGEVFGNLAKQVPQPERLFTAPYDWEQDADEAAAQAENFG